MLSESVVKRLTLSRYLFEQALQNARSEQETADAACVNLLQDAIEIFFLASFDHLNVAVARKTDFPQYLDKLSEALAYDLPYRQRLLELNKVRVLSKHDGIAPSHREVDAYVSTTRNFLEEVCAKVFQKDYWTISLVDLLDNDETKTFLQSAESEFEKQKYLSCLIECRKAFFVAFESSYDTQTDLNNTFSIFGSSAPYFARDKEYIKKHVKTHFDYIYLDHRNLDAELMKSGIDNVAFWNIWRLTPQVYRHKKDDSWLTKTEPRKENPTGIKERAAYVLSSMTSILLTKQNNRRLAKYIDGDTNFTVKLKTKGAKLYEKADKGGTEAGSLPDGVDTVSVEYAVKGLNDDGFYWHALFYQKDPFLMISGFVDQEDLDFG